MKQQYNPTDHFNELWMSTVTSGRLKGLRQAAGIVNAVIEGKTVPIHARSQSEVFDYCHSLQDLYGIRIHFTKDKELKDTYNLSLYEES